MVKKWLYEGIVYHERLKPFNHKFSYKLFFLKFPVSKIDQLKNPLFSLNCFNVFSLYNKDYLDGSDRPLLEKIKEILNAEGVKAEGEIVLQTLPRIFGYGFNPVSFWTIYDSSGVVEAILSEVNNTFGDRHYYLLQNYKEFKKISTPKVFHVSPFFDVLGEYHFSFGKKNTHINYFDSVGGDYFFTSSLLEKSSMQHNPKNLLKLLIKYPLMSFLIIFRIHWQALKLFVKKATFFKRPNPPKSILTKEVFNG